MYVAVNFVLKLLSCVVVFLLIGHVNIWLVQGERSRENIFWNQSQIVFGLFYHIYLNRAEWWELRPFSVQSKLREFLVFSMDCVTCFPSLFFPFPDSFRCVLAVFYPYAYIYGTKTPVNINQYIYIKLIIAQKSSVLWR